MKRKVTTRGSQDALYLWKLLALVGHGPHSLPRGSSVDHPMSASQDISASCSQGRQCPLGTRLEVLTGPYLGNPCFGARFQRARGRACTGGWAKVVLCSGFLTRGRTVVEVCEAETTGGLRQDSARYCTAGTEAKGGRQPLSARNMDMGIGTRRMLAMAAIIRFVCRRHGEI